MMLKIFALLVLVVLQSQACPTISVLESCCVLKNDKFAFSDQLTSGVYKLKIENDCGDCYAETDAYCGGWMVVQRRQTRYYPFNRRWAEYKKGFGKLLSDFLFGLKSLYCLTNKGRWEMRINFQFINGTESYMPYKNFSVGPPETDYKLSVDGFLGVTPTDPLTTSPSDRLPFTKFDRDNDLSSSNCACQYVSTSQPTGEVVAPCLLCPRDLLVEGMVSSANV